MNDPETSRALARGLAAATDLDFELRAAIVDSYTNADTEADLTPEAAQMLQAGRDIINTINEVEGAMRPMPEKMVLWRAADASMFPEGDPASMVRESYREPGFISVSTDRSAVTVPEGGWLMAVVLPAGVSGIYIGEDSELLIDRGTEFRVVSFNASSNVVKVVAVVPESATGAPADELEPALEEGDGSIPADVPAPEPVAPAAAVRR